MVGDIIQKTPALSLAWQVTANGSQPTAVVVAEAARLLEAGLIEYRRKEEHRYHIRGKYGYWWSLDDVAKARMCFELLSGQTEGEP